MAEFKVTPQVLRSTSSNIKSINTNFQGVMKDIETEMNKMKKKWESEAANAFISKFTGLKDNFEAYYKVIDSYTNFLESTAKAYEEADKAINNASGSLFS
ncbi:WXG100 family type VII secretion target [Acetivibrio cellulolyticus]|uniref:WXG100 family type VII secretion target n=1 Tax=Acetivibrio cellulolyticus TaxID=35830 RepID=UPI0001E2D99E|nr:WXG100 family type VII secretion target [Acetivibrio cellulolyticus]